MAEPELIQEPDDEAPPISPQRRRATVTIGCLFALGILVLLVWFIATHTETQGVRGFLGMGPAPVPVELAASA